MRLVTTIDREALAFEPPPCAFTESMRLAALEEARVAVRRMERMCTEWLERMMRDGVSPIDALLDGRPGIVVSRPYPHSPNNEVLVMDDVARILLPLPRGLPCAMVGVAVTS